MNLTGRIVGLTSGTFDLIHFGHLQYLKRCKELCDYLIVGIDSDELVKKMKGPGRPIINHFERSQLIYNLDVVDWVFEVEDLPALTECCVEYLVDKVFKHEGYKRVDHIYGVDDTCAELVIVPDIPGLVSTTEIINRIRKDGK